VVVVRVPFAAPPVGERSLGAGALRALHGGVRRGAHHARVRELERAVVRRQLAGELVRRASVEVGACGAGASSTMSGFDELQLCLRGQVREPVGTVDQQQLASELARRAALEVRACGARASSALSGLYELHLFLRGQVREVDSHDGGGAAGAKRARGAEDADAGRGVVSSRGRGAVTAASLGSDEGRGMGRGRGGSHARRVVRRRGGRGGSGC